MNPGAVVVIVFAALACAVGSFGCGSSTAEPDGPAPPGPTLIVTDKGAVQGLAQDTTRAFLGIPFAAPPVGDLRWKPPAEVAAWSATRGATEYGHACPQVDVLTGGPGTDLVEDCLYLNVWTPLVPPKQPAPVMFFIHGGGFVVGSGGDRTYDGSNLAAKGVVVVTINYRLGAFGFLDHGGLAAEANQAVAPSYGLLDQRAALKWVKKNAAAFGGDANNVTVFGESAGALSVCAQLAMPNSKGLFHRAIMESGYCIPAAFNTPAIARKQGDDFAKGLGCTDLPCMRGKSALAVASALPVRRALFGKEGTSWTPTVDGAELPKLPREVFTAGGSSTVPVILGTNKDEGNLFTFAWNAAFGQDLTEQEGLDVMGLFYTAPQLQALKAQYPLSAYAGAPAWASALISDGLFICPTRQIARSLAGSGSSVYLYQFAHPWNPPLFPNLGVAHSFELPFVFGTSLGGRDIGDNELPTSTAMIGYWTRFATTGDPNAVGAPVWPRYDAAADTHVVLDASIGTGTALRREACDFWDKL